LPVETGTGTSSTILLTRTIELPLRHPADWVRKEKARRKTSHASNVEKQGTS